MKSVERIMLLTAFVLVSGWLIFAVPKSDEKSEIADALEP